MSALSLHARIMTPPPRIAVGLVACVLMTMAAASSATEVAAQAEPARAAALIVQQTNAFRAVHRLPALQVDARLAEAAQRFAEFMASHDQYGHEADGRPPEARVRAHGYEYCAVAENIGYQFSTAGFTSDDLARRLVEGWEQSPGHRRNMLLPNIVDLGVGVARSARTRNHYAVQLFGRPRSASTRFEIANRADVGVRYELEGAAFDLAPRVTRTHEGCFGGDVRLQWPDGSPGPVLAPRQGARYTVVRDNGALRVQSNGPR